MRRMFPSPSKAARVAGMPPSAVPSYAYSAAVDQGPIAAEFPPPPYNYDYFARLSADEFEAIRLRRVKQTIGRAYQHKFYQKLWATVGFEPGDFRSIEQLQDIPAYTVDDLRESLEQNPPFGNHQAPYGGGWPQTPHRIQFSGGTTGMPRPMLYTAHDREIHEIIHARQLWAQGVRPGDTAIVSFAYGPHNAAMALHEALYRWLGVMVIPTSTGNVTSSEKQLAMASRYRATTLLAMNDYLLRLANQAQELGYDLQKDFAFRTFPTLGNTRAVEEAWGRPGYDHYGTYELAAAAFECEMRGGLHMQEDVYAMQIVDVDTGRPVAHGDKGNMVFTSLYHEAYPLVRFNTLDVTRFMPEGRCACGLSHRKIAGFEGRSDTMVKLRGINIWPDALGRIVAEHPASNGEFFCVASRIESRDELTVMVEADGAAHPGLGADLERRIQAQTGVQIPVQLVEIGGLALQTERASRSKPRRFEDRRK